VSWLAETTTGTRAAFPANSGIASAPPQVIDPANKQQLPAQQILGSFTANVSVAIPALSQNAVTTLSFQVPLSSFPSPFKVLASRTAVIQSNIVLAQKPNDPTTTIHTPVLSLSLGAGGTTQTGTGTWTLPPGSYTAPVLQASVGVSSSSAGVGPQTAVFTVTAQLLGLATTVPPTPTLTPKVLATSPNTPPTTPQVAIVTLVAGTATWVYPVPYLNVPVVLATPYTSPVSGTPEIWVGSVTKTQASINSTAAGDTRQVAVLAQGNPD